MRFGASNIAWDPADDRAAAAIVRARGGVCVELAPTKVWPDLAAAAPAALAAYRRFWADEGLFVSSFQALLFGAAEARVFDDGAGRTALVDRMRRVMDIAFALGAGPLVFGSPGARRRGTLELNEAMHRAADLFRTLGDNAAERGLTVGVEANPPEYGCDFLTRTAESAAFVRMVDHPAVRVHLDLGGITMVGDAPADAVRAAAEAGIAHAHASEPMLGPVGARGTRGTDERFAAADHEAYADALGKAGYTGLVVLEMKQTTDAPLDALDRALARVQAAYGA